MVAMPFRDRRFDARVVPTHCELASSAAVGRCRENAEVSVTLPRHVLGRYFRPTGPIGGDPADLRLREDRGTEKCE